MIENITELLEKRIAWNEGTTKGIQFYAYIDGELCQLTMNDYPDEPLFTLKWNDRTLDLDDRPNGWELPPMK